MIRVNRTGTVFFAVITIQCILWLVGCFSFGKTKCDEFIFAPHAWRVASLEGDERSERSKIADDLDRCNELIGLSKRAIIRLLGKPIEPTTDAWSYRTGKNEYHSDEARLDIEFNGERNKVKKVYSPDDK